MGCKRTRHGDKWPTFQITREGVFSFMTYRVNSKRSRKQGSKCPNDKHLIEIQGFFLGETPSMKL